MRHRQHYPLDVNVQDWSQWPYVQRTGRPNVAAHWPWGYPTIKQTRAYMVYGPPPQPKLVNHGLHATLSLITVGCWLPVWFIITIVTHASNSRAEADYWSRIQKYWQWEVAQRRVTAPLSWELIQGG